MDMGRVEVANVEVRQARSSVLKIRPVSVVSDRRSDVAHELRFGRPLGMVIAMRASSHPAVRGHPFPDSYSTRYSLNAI